MTETFRTIIYIVVALAALLVGWWAKPATIDRKTFDDAGERFFAQFDPLEAKSLEIVSFNEATSNRVAFKVAQQDGRWSIPSHAGYPADAQDHLAQAASSIMDLEKGAVVSDLASDHALYGVVDPTAGSTAASGAGSRVTLQDDSGKSLVDVIIGKPVKDSQTLRYLRVPGKDRVYTAQVNTQQLTTKFEDWIERDLLKLNSYQIKEVVIDDYSIDEINSRIVRGAGGPMTLQFNQAENKWSMISPPLGTDETLKSEKLQEMQTALADLRIVDVHRKPAGLSGQLRTSGSVQLDMEAIASLMSRGYFIVENQLKSNEGDLIIRTNEGIEYTLRFGEIASVAAGAGADLSTPDSEGEAPEQSGRYLFVTASFDSALIEAPQLDPVPEVPASETPDDPTTAVLKQAHDAAVTANEQKQAEYDKKVADGQEKVRQLNSRFADWYYVVSDSVYQKLRLRRGDLVTTGASPSGAGPVSGPSIEHLGQPH